MRLKRVTSIPLTAFAWVILLGVTVFILFFYAAFTASSERERSAVQRLGVQDSLLSEVFDVLRKASVGEGNPAGHRARLDQLQRHHLALLEQETARFPETDRFRDALAAYAQFGRSIIAGRHPGDYESRFREHERVKSVHRAYATRIVAAADEGVREAFDLWAVISFVIVLAGFWFIMFLASKERRQSEQIGRFASVASATTEPVAVFDHEGRLVMVNDAFRKQIGETTVTADETPVRFGFLRTSDPLDAGRLWQEMMEGLSAASSWTGSTDARVIGGQDRSFTLTAIASRDDAGGLREVVVLFTDTTEARMLRRQARQALDQYRLMVDHSPDATVIIRGERVLYANRSALRLFGFQSQREMYDTVFLDLFGSAGVLAFDVDLDQKEVGDEILRNAEFRASTRIGKLIDVEASAAVVTWDDQLAVQVAFRDITDRKMLEREQALWAWEQDALTDIDRRLAGIVDLHKILEAILLQVLNLSRAHWAGILMYDDNPSTVTWRAMAGHLNPDASGSMFSIRPAVLALFSGTEPLVLQQIGDEQAHPLSGLPGLEREELISTVWLPLRLENKAVGALAVGYRSYHHFVTREMRLLSSLAEKTSIALGNAELYQHLLRREQELEALSGARVDAQEEERRRIAREIHDGLGQILTAIKLNVEILEDSPELKDDDLDKLKDVKQLLDNVMQEARDISFNLMPSVLDDFGLAPAVQLLSDRLSRQSGVQVSFFGKNTGARLQPRMEVALYRIVQEALNNAIRHGSASQVAIQLSLTEDVLRLTIEDNGKGMATGAADVRRQEGGGLGLASMRERVNSFGGSFAIDSAAGKGTLIVVELPLTANTPVA